jgi:hypothetical protein
MNKEQLALRAQIDRQLLALDQKIERQDHIKAAADAALADLYAAREGLLASAVALRTGGQQ